MIAAAIQVVGDAFIRLLQVTVVPYITVSPIGRLGCGEAPGRWTRRHDGEYDQPSVQESRGATEQYFTKWPSIHIVALPLGLRVLPHCQN